MYGIQGLLPLRMKQRNDSRWTPAERAQLQAHLRSLTTLSPYLLDLLAQDSFALFPSWPGGWTGADKHGTARPCGS